MKAVPGFTLGGGTMLEIVHYLHVLAGVIWAGGFVVYAVIIFPALARQPAETAGRIWERMLPPTMAMMAGSAVLVLVLGLIRAFLGGGLTRFSQLGSGYGLTILAAIGIWLFLEAYGERDRANFRRMTAEPEAFAANAQAEARQHAIVTLAASSVLIGLMALMGPGVV